MEQKWAMACGAISLVSLTSAALPAGCHKSKKSTLGLWVLKFAFYYLFEDLRQHQKSSFNKPILSKVFACIARSEVITAPNSFYLFAITYLMLFKVLAFPRILCYCQKASFIFCYYITQFTILFLSVQYFNNFFLYLLKYLLVPVIRL